MWLLMRVFLFVAAFLAFCALLSILTWLVFGDGFSMLRARWRTRRHLKRRQVLSPSWWRTQERQTERVEFHGPKIAWPIRKDVH